ncbi:MAG: iron chaperone [Anaerolineae bacterium]|jgi:hypothetical protein|nr:DUF1801 domain-containing protein [Chloroflexota bacterium]
MRSNATSVAQYLQELPPERRPLMEALRDTLLAHLPDGYVEALRWGMLSYEVPLTVYPDTYNGEPLAIAALANQKNHVSLYLMGIYGDQGLRERLVTAWRASGKRLDMGKSCLRVRRLEEVPLEVVAEAIAALPVEEYVARARARALRRR